MICFGTLDGKEIGRLGTISEAELMSDESGLKISDKPVEMECKFEFDPFRAFLPQGLYNAYVLRRDGYLSPKNGWMNGEENSI